MATQRKCGWHGEEVRRQGRMLFPASYTGDPSTRPATLGMIFGGIGRFRHRPARGVELRQYLRLVDDDASPQLLPLGRCGIFPRCLTGYLSARGGARCPRDR